MWRSLSWRLLDTESTSRPHPLSFPYAHPRLSHPTPLTPVSPCPHSTDIMAAMATKQQSQKIFEKLKTKPANRVSPLKLGLRLPLTISRSALTVARRIQHGLRFLLASIYVLTALLYTETWAFTSLSFAQRTWIVRPLTHPGIPTHAILTNTRMVMGPAPYDEGRR